MTPEEKEMQGTAVKPLQAIKVAVDCLQASLNWVHTETLLKQKFCFDFLTACFQRIPMLENSVDWVEKYHTILLKLVKVYGAAIKQCKDYAALRALLSEDSAPSTRQYFQFIERIHKILTNWKSMIEGRSANYDFILKYEGQHEHIHSLAKAVSAEGLIVDVQEAMEAQQNFWKQFDSMNRLLIKYIHDDPKLGW